MINERHGFAIAYPDDIFEQKEEPKTDEGRVFVSKDGKAKLLPVKVGLQTDTSSEVLGGSVKAGTLVITTRPDALQNGSVVAIGGAPPAAGPPGSGPNPTQSGGRTGRKAQH